MRITRRTFIGMAGAATAAGLFGLRPAFAAVKGRVVVAGGGFGGATVAKYLRLWGGPDLDVTLVERSPGFVSCPMSNLVLSGDRKLADITQSYDKLKGRHGVKLVQGEVTGIDPAARTLQLAGGQALPYDRLVVAPGIDLLYDQVPGLTPELADTAIPHAWKAGPQTLLLRKQLEDMRDGGVVAICIPKIPYRCPPGPYERACLIAHYLKNNKPKSKLLILDANDDVVSKKGLFTKVWSETYKGIVDYRKEHSITALDPATRTLRFEFGEKVRADVLNIVPPQMAGGLAKAAGLVNQNARWCGVDWLTLESTAVPGIHVVGDATFPAPGMPKSGHMANQQAKVAAAAILRLLAGQPVSTEPMVTNTCYSFVDAKNAIHVASVHRYDPAEKTFLPVTGASGLSEAPSEIEGKFALSWARNIWADTLG